MLLRRVSVLSLLLVSLAGFISISKHNSNALTPNIWQGFENPPSQKWGRHGLMDELNLRQEQQQKLQLIQYRYKDKIEDLQEGIDRSNQEFRSLMISNIDPGQIRNKHQEVQDLRQKLDKLRLESMLEMREVLTPNQRSQFARMMARRKDNFHKMSRDRSPEEFR